MSLFAARGRIDSARGATRTYDPGGQRAAQDIAGEAGTGQTRLTCRTTGKTRGSPFGRGVPNPSRDAAPMESQRLISLVLAAVVVVSAAVIIITSGESVAVRS